MSTKATFEKLGSALLKAKVKAGVSEEDKAIILEIIAEREAKGTKPILVKVEKSTAKAAKNSDAKAPTVKAKADKAEDKAAAEKAKAEKAEAAAKAKAEKAEATEKAKAEKAEAVAKAKAEKAEAKAAAKAATQWALKGQKVNFTTFAGGEVLTGEIIGKVLDKRVNTILVRIVAGDKTYHKTVGGITLVEPTEATTMALDSLKADQEGMRVENANPVAKLAAQLEKAEARVATLRAEYQTALNEQGAGVEEDIEA